MAWHPRATGYGEIEMLAVDPASSNRGHGKALTAHAIAALKSADCQLVMVSTGGDPGHAPARRVYEKAGFRPLSIVQFWQQI